MTGNGWAGRLLARNDRVVRVIPSERQPVTAKSKAKPEAAVGLSRRGQRRLVTAMPKAKPEAGRNPVRLRAVPATSPLPRRIDTVIHDVVAES